MTTTVTGKRQITIPAKLARDFGIETGTRLEWERGSDDCHIVLIVQPSKRQFLERAREIGRKYRHSGWDSAAILDREREMDEGSRLAALTVAEPPADYGARKKGARK